MHNKIDESLQKLSKIFLNYVKVQIKQHNIDTPARVQVDSSLSHTPKKQLLLKVKENYMKSILINTILDFMYFYINKNVKFFI